ncbi:MAG: hypothetical protein PHD81_03385 [Candidatus Nanoarchaeia archaeon]|nr:hypothetical protein [Candidatus Nanoarchaeia archaeon]MDD5588128.1 hypothetical protein [Candidatus Nanoarchaeia archaeon]
MSTFKKIMATYGLIIAVSMCSGIGSIHLLYRDKNYRSIEHGNKFQLIKKYEGFWKLDDTKFIRSEYHSDINNEIYRSDKVSITKFKLNTSKIMEISDGIIGEYDGLVDKITIHDDQFDGVFIRKKDYKEFKKEFDNADKFLADSKQRFKKELDAFW